MGGNSLLLLPKHSLQHEFPRSGSFGSGNGVGITGSGVGTMGFGFGFGPIIVQTIAHNFGVIFTTRQSDGTFSGLPFPHSHTAITIGYIPVGSVRRVDMFHKYLYKFSPPSFPIGSGCMNLLR